MITILTSTYNRAYILDKAYQSLLRQTDADFEWIIIDDGSTDNTKELVENWIAENRITIIYEYKKNGGKQAALNDVFPLAKGELIIILDSDDYLSDDAVATIKHEWNQLSIQTRKEIAGLVFLRGYSSTTKPMSTFYPINYHRTNFIKLRHKDHVKGDKAEVLRTDIWREFPFPIYFGEKFCTEMVVFYRIARKYDAIFINKIIYFGDYLNDGLTAKLKHESARKNLQGKILCYNEQTTIPFPLGIRINHAIKYIRYSLFLHSPFATIRQSCCKWLCVCMMPIGIIDHLRTLLQERNFININP
jgi:glycosyltransferase involved in cell wall biosynthesis